MNGNEKKLAGSLHSVKNAIVSVALGRGPGRGFDHGLFFFAAVGRGFVGVTDHGGSAVIIFGARFLA